MENAPSSRPRRRISQRIRDLSVIAPVFGLVMLAPPIVSLFANGGSVFGAPVILVYLFAVWLGLIVLAALLSRLLGRTEPNGRDAQ